MERSINLEKDEIIDKLLSVEKEINELISRKRKALEQLESLEEDEEINFEETNKEVQKIEKELESKKEYNRKSELAKKSAIVGRGVEIKKSQIENAGNGLFATRYFKKGEVVTKYSGEIISRKDADELRGKEKDTHFFAIAMGREVISGLTDPKEAFGKGGGSFANDSRGNKSLPYNGKLQVIHDEKKGQDSGYITAISDINPGDEIFVNYGKDYWKKYEKRMAQRNF